MIFVFSLGGSVVAGRDAESLKQYASALKELAASHQIYVVVGGGKIAREYIEKARALGASEMFCDQIGIGATKLNSALLVAALGESAPQEIPDGYAAAARLAEPGRVVVMGGVAPGQTTDAVAALLAEYVRADRLIIPTSVDGVYTADPEKDPEAKKISRMTAQELARLASGTEMKAPARPSILWRPRSSSAAAYLRL